jgi:hypothetical protein
MKKPLQYLADSVIREMEKTSNEDLIEFYYEFGIWLDGIAINWFKIYLN